MSGLELIALKSHKMVYMLILMRVADIRSTKSEKVQIFFLKLQLNFHEMGDNGK